jgi:hypothetical protein
MRQFAFTVMPLLILISAFSCFDKESPNHPVEVRFDLLNESGEPSSIFKEGEDIIFRYSIINNSSNPVTVNNFQEVLGNNFMLVLESYQGDDGAMRKKVIGYPYDGIKIIDVFGLEIVAYDTLVMQASWKGKMVNTEFVHGFDIGYKSDRTSLSLGSYLVEFEHTITFAKYENIQVRIEKDFEVF